MRRASVLAVIVAWLLSGVAFAQQNVFTLRMVYPMPAGSGLDTLDADNRAFFAYPGIEYRIKIAAGGGCLPFTYSLTGNPAWMSVDASTGLISGTPTDTTTDDDASITATVTDCDGSTASRVWGVDVQTGRFKFVDAVNGSPHSTNGGSGTGAIGTPWKTLDDIYDGSSGTDIVYFLSGTYTTANLPQDSISATAQQNGEHRVTWNSSTRSTQWIVHPAHVGSAVIDYEYTGTGYPYDSTGTPRPRFRFNGDTIVLIGLSTTRSMTMAFQFGATVGNRHGVYVDGMTMGSHGPGIDEGNSAHLMWQAQYGGGGIPDTQTYGDVVIDSEFYGLLAEGATDGNNCSLKFYSTLKAVVARNTFHTAEDMEEAIVAIKSDNTEIDFRENVFYGIEHFAIGGNLNQVTDQSTGEIRFNNVKSAGSSGSAFGFYGAQDIEAPFVGPLYVYRNTFQGRVWVRTLGAGDGPITYTHNVIINDGGSQSPWTHIFDSGVTDTGQLTDANNLKGTTADNIVGADGNLNEPYLTSDGPNSGTPKGHMLSAVVSSGPVSKPFRTMEAGPQP